MGWLGRVNVSDRLRVGRRRRYDGRISGRGEGAVSKRNSWQHTRVGKRCSYARCFSLSFGNLILIVAALCVNGQDLQRGVDYLANQQEPASDLWNFGQPRGDIDSMAAVRGLLRVDADGADMVAARAIAAIEADAATQEKTVSGLATALELVAGTDPAALLDARNADGGWGPAAGKQSDPLDTVIALDALLSHGIVPENGWEPTAAYLIATRSSDGFWNFTDETAVSRLELSARVLSALRRLRDDASLQSPELLSVLADGAALLRSLYRSDGRFSIDDDVSAPVAITATAECYRALVQSDPPALYANTLSLFGTLQNADGSWSEPDQTDQDVYTTAVVLFAISTVNFPPASPRADLAVFPASIAFEPQAPLPGQSVTIRTVVFNVGDVAAQNVEVQLFHGDPRSGGTPVGATIIIQDMFPGGSGIVTHVLDTSGFTSGPQIFAIVDPRNKVPETTLENNAASRALTLAGVPDEPQLSGIDLFIAPESITFNDAHVDTVFLTNSPTVMLGAVVANLGDQPSGSFTVQFLDGALAVGRVTWPTLGARKGVAFRIPWIPGSGARTVSVTADIDDVVSEFDETNNTGMAAVEIVGASAAVVARRFIDGQEVEPPFSAYDVGRLTVATAYQDVAVALEVTNADTGSPAITQPAPLPEAGKYQWNVVNAEPGEYTATAVFTSGSTKVLLDTAVDNFEVLTTVGLRSLKAFVANDVVEGGNILPQFITVLLENGSNVDAAWQVTWELYDPVGLFLIGSSSAESLDIGAGQSSHTAVLAEPIVGSFETSGRYRVVVNADHAGGATYAAETRFNILPILQLNIVNDVVPGEVSALDRARVTTIINLTAAAENSNLNLPVAIRDVAVVPNHIADDTAETSRISAKGIVNALGEHVPDGTPVTVYIPYGDIIGGAPPPLSLADPEGFPPNPQVRIFSVSNGRIDVDYEPTGATIGSDQGSVAVMQFHQFIIDDDQWFGLNIGNAEIFVQNE